MRLAGQTLVVARLCARRANCAALSRTPVRSERVSAPKRFDTYPSIFSQNMRELPPKPKRFWGWGRPRGPPRLKLAEVPNNNK